MSKYIPNSYQTPNVIVDEMIAILTDTEFKMYHLVLRNTIGWQKTISKSLTIANMMDLMNKSKPTVAKATKGLRELKLIKEHGTKRTGFSYSINFEITGERVEQKWFANADDSLKYWLKNLTIKERASKNNGKNIYPLMVKYFNHLYILNTDFKHNIKIYKKISENKSEKSKKVSAPKVDLLTQEVFAEFKSKYAFINFEDYRRMVEHLQLLNGTVAKSRITKNLSKCKMKDKSFVSAKTFVTVVAEFVNQKDYKGIFVSWDIQTGNRKNKVDELPAKKSENMMTDEELDAEIAKKLGEVA